MTAHNLDDILKKSSRLMALQGFHGTSMRDLARATQRSLAGLYHYFKSKEDLLYLLNINGFTSLLHQAEVICKKTFSPEEKLYELVANHINYFGTHQDEMKVLMFGTQVLDKTRGKKITLLKDSYTDIFMKAVGDALNSHRARTGLKLTKRELARKTYLLFGMMNWIFGWYAEETHGPLSDVINDIYTTFTRGTFGETYEDTRIHYTKMRNTVSRPRI